MRRNVMQDVKPIIYQWAQQEILNQMSKWTVSTLNGQLNVSGQIIV